jgi:AraC-like DNA-binding protein
MARLNETRIGALLTEPFGASLTCSARTSLHREHGTAVLIGVDGDVTAAGVRGRAVIVPPDTEYAATSAGPVAAFVFDPELCPRIAARARADGPRVLASGEGAVVACRAELANPAVLAGIGGELERRLATGTPARGDRRIAQLVETLRDPEADAVAAIARPRLSPAHLQALFARDIGIPMRTYRLWRRLLHALARVGPLDLTGAAHAAGFADLAHFSRTCRRMLGYAPSELRARLAEAAR